MNLAKSVSTWSKDPSTCVGAVVVFPETGQILSTGYNGFPRGIDDTEERLNNREVKYGLTIHAELNAMHNANLIGVSLKDSTLYSCGLPTCSKCALSIIQSGINTVVIREEDIYKSDHWNEEWLKSEKLYNESNIEVIIIKYADTKE